MAKETTSQEKAQIDALFEEMENVMVQLYLRWQDEKDYEDFDDYAESMRVSLPKSLPTGFNFLKATRRPFGFTFHIGTLAVYRIAISGNQYKWSRVK